MRGEDDSVGRIADAIERYLATHPEAADSVEGIQRWWLPDEVAEEAPGRVREALVQLEARGTVAPRRLPDGRVIYAATRRPR